MNITINCKTNKRFPGVIYAVCYNETGQLVLSATLDYVLSYTKRHNWTISNAQEILIWLHLNSDSKAY